MSGVVIREFVCFLVWLCEVNGHWVTVVDLIDVFDVLNVLWCGCGVLWVELCSDGWFGMDCCVRGVEKRYIWGECGMFWCYLVLSSGGIV